MILRNDAQRRRFLVWILGIFTAALGGILSVPLIRFALYPLFSKTTETTWSDLGDLNEFAAISSPVKRVISYEHRDGWRRIVSEKPVFIVRHSDGRLRVLSPVCPHLGCLIHWDVSRAQFVSPCHNGIFSSTGSRISGPPRRDMDVLESKVERNRLLVKYQYFRPLIPTQEVIG